MLEQVKLALRYKTNFFDDEINMYIKACMNDMKLAGVDENKMTDENESIMNAIISYCKWQLNFQNRGEKWEEIYKGLKTALALDMNYNVH